jgi:hypothetical protein
MANTEGRYMTKGVCAPTAAGAPPHRTSASAACARRACAAAWRPHTATRPHLTHRHSTAQHQQIVMYDVDFGEAQQAEGLAGVWKAVRLG